MAEQVQQSAVPPGADPAAYAQQMADRADGKPQQQEQKLLAGKYKTVEELEKGYAELMKLHGGKPQAQEQTQQQPQQVQQQQTQDVQTAQQAVQQAGLDFGALSAEWAEHGDLTPESYKALQEKSGIPPEIVK